MHNSPETVHQQQLATQAEVYDNALEAQTLPNLTKLGTLAYLIGQLQSDLFSLSEVILSDGDAHQLMLDMGLCADQVDLHLSDLSYWEDASDSTQRSNVQEMRHALTKLQVSLLIMAEIISQIAGKPYNIVDWAQYLSSGHDITRGVRTSGA